jgi:hypothetical protein
MRQPSSPPPRRRIWTGGGTVGFFQNLVYIIIIVNLIIYLASFINSTKLVDTFGVTSSSFTQNPWAILTAMFVHVDFWHIFGNMLVLFFFGQVVYQLIGTKWFLFVYFIGGIVGNLLYVWLGSSVPAIGASGAIYALAGALVVIVPTMRVNIWGIIPMPLWAFVLIFMVLWSIPNFIPDIAWQAHLGGIVVGLIAGYFFRKKIRINFYR